MFNFQTIPWANNFNIRHHANQYYFHIYHSITTVGNSLKLNIFNRKSIDRNGQMKLANPDSDVEYAGGDGAFFERQTVAHSQCPILGGVIHTRWGAVSAGNLIAGIAAGLEPQRVSLTELFKTPNMSPNTNVQQFVTSIFPATIGGKYYIIL